MAHDDRFFTLVCCAALLITGSVFLWTHHGSIHFEVASLAGSNAEIERTPATPNPPRASDAADAGSVFVHAAVDSPAAVPAVFEPQIASGVARASFGNPNDPDPDQVLGVVEAIIQLQSPKLDGWGLPTQQDILVRTDRDGRLVVAAGTHRRYDRVREAITALDGPTVADACDAIERRLAMGVPGEGLFRAKVVEVLDLLLAAEVPDVELDMVSRGTYWGFADPGLDDLSPAQKHMLMMGLDNQRIVRSRLQDIRQYLGGSPSVASTTNPSVEQTELLIARHGQSTDQGQSQITEP